LRHYNENVFSRFWPALLIVTFIAVDPVSLHAQRTTVLVNAFGNETGDRSLDWTGEGLATAIADRLVAYRQLYVFARDERIAEYERLGVPEPLSVSRATSIRMAWDLGADVLVTGRYLRDHDELHIEARVLNLSENTIDLDLSVTGKPDELLSTAASLASRLAGVLVPGSALPASNDSVTIPGKAFEAYIRGVMSIDSQRRVELLQEAIRLHPQYSSAIYQLGLVRYLDMESKESTALLQRVPAEAPEYPMARFMMGINSYHSGDFGRAAAIYSALEPSYDILVNLGASIAAGGDRTAASPVLRRAAERNPSGSEAAFDLAYISFVGGQFEAAAARFSQYLRARERDSEVLFLLGQAYSKLGRAEEARRLTDEAVHQSPSMARWTSQGIPNLLRIRTQFDATELRLPGGVWNEARKARRLAVPVQ
jgi:tetratricopeptide (TPR) repeat protein